MDTESSITQLQKYGTPNLDSFSFQCCSLNIKNFIFGAFLILKSWLLYICVSVGPICAEQAEIAMTDN